MWYENFLEKFVAEGADLIRQNPAERYGGRVAGARPLEPGFVPLFGPPRVVVISYHPNGNDVPGGSPVPNLRGNFERWGEEASLDAYRTAYEDWVALLPHVPFHRKYTAPVLERLGIGNDEFAWIPLIKVPLPPDSLPGEDVIYRDVLDIDGVMPLKSRPLWLQGARTIRELRDRLSGPQRFTVVVEQKTPQRISATALDADHDRVANELREAVAVRS